MKKVPTNKTTFFIILTLLSTTLAFEEKSEIPEDPKNSEL